jgi:hypothetical protein
LDAGDLDADFGADFWSGFGESAQAVRLVARGLASKRPHNSAHRAVEKKRWERRGMLKNHNKTDGDDSLGGFTNFRQR